PAQDPPRPAVPTGDVAEVGDRALTLLAEGPRRKKIGAAERPRTSRGTAPGRRGVAAKGRRTAWNHDEGRCSFVSKGGRRCNESAFIEFDHVVPYGVGGQGTVENIRHNVARTTRSRASASMVAGDRRSRALPGKSWRPRDASRSGRLQVAVEELQDLAVALDLVLLLEEPVTLVGEDDVLDGHAVLLDRGHDVVGLRLDHPRVVRPL